MRRLIPLLASCAFVLALPLAASADLTGAGVDCSFPNGSAFTCDPSSATVEQPPNTKEFTVDRDGVGLTDGDANFTADQLVITFTSSIDPLPSLTTVFQFRFLDVDLASATLLDTDIAGFAQGNIDLVDSRSLDLDFSGLTVGIGSTATIAITVVPEPKTASLMMLGLSGLAYASRRHALA